MTTTARGVAFCFVATNGVKMQPPPRQYINPRGHPHSITTAGASGTPGRLEAVEQIFKAY